MSHAGRQLEGDSPRDRLREGARQKSGPGGAAAGVAASEGKRGAAARGGGGPDLHALKSWAVSDLDAFIAQVSVALVSIAWLV